MKNIKNFSSFLGGVLTVLLVAGCLNTALAASGKVSYNFSNVALGGETKITAGQDITAANGQKVPGTILFTDAAGGKTNYLPIRAVSELLGVEIGYDSATKTVLLGGQLTVEPAEPASTAETVSGRQWQRELGGENGGIFYTWPKGNTVQDYKELPAFRPTVLPEGFALYNFGVNGPRGGVSNACITWQYGKDGENGVSFTCYRPNTKPCGANFGPMTDTAAARRDATVQGHSADFYEIDGDITILVWEDKAGNLFWLQGSLDQVDMEKIANSVKEIPEEPLPNLEFSWMPEGFQEYIKVVSPGMVGAQWTKVTKAEGQPEITDRLIWYYSREPLIALAATPETATVKGIQARYWPGDLNARGYIASTGGKVDSISTSEAQMNTLLWTDPQTNITFRLLAPLDKDVMIRMAESISPK